MGIAASLMLSVSSCRGQAYSAADIGLVSSSSDWVEFDENPVLRYDPSGKGILLNDPSVIKDGSRYRMWLTGGRPFDKPLVVRAYEAFSDDGIDWTTDYEPILEPGDAGTWDEARIETVSVIKVGDTYHMYYAGCAWPCDTGQFGIGHAVSDDGTNWVKDAGNPVVEAHEEPLEWGFYTAAEPSVVHHDGTFYLYYASARSNWPDYGAPFGVMLATSDDSSNFEIHGPVHTMSDAYDIQSFRGYSTPMVFVADGQFHLYYDVVHTPKKPSDFDQVAISHAVGDDGYSFTEVDTNIVTIGEDWKQTNVHGPTVIKEGDTTKMWYAGRTNRPRLIFGIGYATRQDD